MGSVNTPPASEARTIFSSLGYTVTGEGAEFSATRGWKEVSVSAVEGSPREGDGDARLRCFVTWDGEADRLTARLRRAETPYEWAVIGVEDGGDYEVRRAP